MVSFDVFYHYFMLLQTFKTQYNTMQFTSSSVARKRKLETISSWVQIVFLILCISIQANQAGVIKKLDTGIEATEIVFPLSTALNNTSKVVVVATKLQSVEAQNAVTETSKELTNNEILITEAKKKLEENNPIKSLKNETKLKIENEEENYENKSETSMKSQDNTKDLQQIAQHFESTAHNLNETHKTPNEFSSNDIREEKIPKPNEKEFMSSAQNNKDSSDNESYSSWENNLKSVDKNPRAPSRILTELRTETENPLTALKIPNKVLENSLESSRENKELPTLNTVTNSSVTSNSGANVAQTKIIETAGGMSEARETESQLKTLKSPTAAPSVTENLQFLQISTSPNPLKYSENRNQIQSSEYFTKPIGVSSQEPQTNQIQDGLQPQEMLKSIMVLTTTDALLAVDQTTLTPMATENDLLSFEGNKQEYARALYREDTTTTISRAFEEQPSTLVTTFKPLLSSTNQVMAETTQESFKVMNKTVLSALHVKEKKPKFINDNSTNAQQLNLPNNAEAWSLAAMKSLPMANTTIETAQTHNQTNKEFQENSLYNTTWILNNNSEKNLLDWSQIMRDKELSTTTQHEDYERPVVEGIKQNPLRNEVSTIEKDITMDTTTFIPGIEMTHFKMQPREDVITKNSLIEHEQTTTTISSTILSTLNYSNNQNDSEHEKNNRPDKKVEEYMNNHIDTLTVTTMATNIANNLPFNASLNTEANLNEINLTSNQTQVDLNNNNVQTKTTAGNEIADSDVNANASVETSTVAATMATQATAVIDVTTIEQSSSETTTVSMLETAKQNAPISNSVINNINNNVTYVESNYSLSASHNALENIVVDKQVNQKETIDFVTKTTTAVPITTLRPTILTITTSTTSLPATFEQEVDQKSNEIKITNFTNTQQQSITKTDLHYNNSTKAIETNLTAREFETTTIETLTTTTAAATATATASKIEIAVTSSLENETTTTTSSFRDELINETTEINLNSSETAATTQTTPQQVNEHKNKGDEATTTGSSVAKDETFEKKSKAAKTTTEIIFSSITFTTAATPVVSDTEKHKALIESITPTTTTTTTTEQNNIATTTGKQEGDSRENIFSEEDAKIESTTKAMHKTQATTTTAATTTTSTPSTTAKEEETYISLLDDTTTTTTTTQTYTSTSPTRATSYASTTTLSPLSSEPTLPSAITTKVEEIYNVLNSTTTTEITETTTQQLLTEIEEESSSNPSSTTTTSTYFTEMLPRATSTHSSQMIVTADIGKSLPTLTSIMGGNSGNLYPKNSGASGETDINVIIAITVSVIGVIALILLVGFLYLMRKRQKQTSYSQRCRPVSLDEYTIDNASVGGSMRKSSALRASKRTYGNLAFDDPSLRPNPMGVHELAKFVQEKLRIYEEFRDVPQITSRLDEVPIGCEDKNRYANVLPLPETRVILQRLNDDEKSEYINANYVTGPKDPPNYYIACQAPLESTVEDFWRMIWEQQSRVIIQATDLIENGIEKCAEYLPPSVTLDNHASVGDFQITLQNREVKDKYAISTVVLKHVVENSTRELTHYWYKWPEVGVPAEEAPIIAMLLEARSSLISYAIEQANEIKEKSSMATLKSDEEGTVSANDSTTTPTNNSNCSSANGSTGEINGNMSMVHIKKAARNQGPLTIHCSPGTGRTGTIIACDIAIRSLETPKRTIDIPQIVYYVRRGRASAVLTKEQYEFIYKVANMYAAKITNPTNYN